MHLTKTPEETLFLKKIFFTATVLFFLQCLLSGLLIYHVALNETANQIKTVANRVQEDLSYQKGKWDTKRYNADPELPGTYPLYIFGTDGFTIDRWKPLHGFLDTSDEKKLLSYTSAQTITTDTNQSWRIVSKQIISHGQKVGVLTVASFNPQEDQLATIDSLLEQNANFILSKISIKNGSIDTKNLDIRDVNYNVTFQIVDAYNTIITKANNTNSIDRIPNFIDTSYIGNILQGSQIQTITDSVSKEKFLVYAKPLYNNQHYVLGVIVVGKSISFITSILYAYAITEGILGSILIFTFTFFIFRLGISFAHTSHTTIHRPEIRNISFDKKTSILSFDTHTIAIPYATNQYYLLETVFSNPKRRWEIDEILEKFGDIESTNWRKVYDAMNMVNKKVFKYLGERLIIVKDKTYSINPLYASLLS